MVELDYGNIYNNIGKILQVQYAAKAASAGSTIVAMRNKKGAMIFVAKPIVSCLHVRDGNHRIQKVSEKIYTASTGVLPDGKFIAYLCGHSAKEYKKTFKQEVPGIAYRRMLGNYLYMYTQYLYTRVIGAHMLTIMKDENEYRVYGTETSGAVSEYSAIAYGKGDRRAQTELEKLDFESMEMKDLLENGIRIMFKVHDSMNDPEFNIECGFISEDSNGEFVRVAQDRVDELIEKYKDLSMDEDEEAGNENEH